MTDEELDAMIEADLAAKERAERGEQEPAPEPPPKREGHHPQTKAWAEKNKDNYTHLPASVVEGILDGMDKIFDAYPQLAEVASKVPEYEPGVKVFSTPASERNNLLQAAGVLDYIIGHEFDSTDPETLVDYKEGPLSIRVVPYNGRMIDYRGSSYHVTAERMKQLLRDDAAALEEMQDIEAWLNNVDKSFRPKKKIKKDKPPKPPKNKPPKPDLQDERAKAKKDVADAWGALLGKLKKPGTTAPSTGFDPEIMGLAVDLVRALVKDGVVEFKVMVQQALQLAPEMIDALTPYLEGAWRVMKKRDTTGEMSPAGKVADVVSDMRANKENVAKGDAETEYQVTYPARSKNKPVGVLLPKNHVGAVTAALDAIEETYGDIDEFVRNELGFGEEQFKNAFSAEQVDALAMAIHNHKNGDAFITGDQTGVGKGRIVAAMIWYAIKNDIIPVFVTEKPPLYADMIRDLTALGLNPSEEEFNPLITNTLDKPETVIDLNSNLSDEEYERRGPRVIRQELADARATLQEAVGGLAKNNGKLIGRRKVGRGKKATTEPVKYHAVFTTYDQLSPKGGEENERAIALRELIPNAYLILDESHNAAGTGQQQNAAAQHDHDVDPDDPDAETIPIKRSEIFRNLVAEAQNVFYSSATYAKRADVMDLYSRAGIARAVTDLSLLPAIFAEGGVPLQQVLSEMLAEGGLYLRRERSFDGISFTPKVAEVDLGIADATAQSCRAINDFSDALADVIDTIAGGIISGGGVIASDGSTGRAGVGSINFSSILHNLVDNMLFALKADAVADEAIAAYKERGESPVIVADKTGETKLNEFLAEFGYKNGDIIPYTFRDLLHKYLERSREITIKPDVTDKKQNYQYYLTDDDLGPVALDYYNRAKAKINEFTSDIPASPIDWIRHRLKEAGMTVSEMTGRDVILDYSSGKTTPTVVSRAKDELGSAGKQKTVKGFNDGSINVVILNRSGSTGISLHNHVEFKNDRPRHMIIAQADKNIDVFMQALGRIHRTGQRATVVQNGETVSALPRFTLFLTNAPAEIRPSAVLVKKLASLNANVTASAKGSVSFDVPDVINQIGDRVVAEWIRENREFNHMMGEPVHVDDRGRLQFFPGVAQKVTGRVALLDIKDQQEFWDGIVESYDIAIDELNAIGANPLVAAVIDLQAKTLERFSITEGDQESKDPFAQPAYLETVSALPQIKPLTSKEILEEVTKFYGKGELDMFAVHAWSDATIASIQAGGESYLEQKIAEIMERPLKPEEPIDPSKPRPRNPKPTPEQERAHTIAQLREQVAGQIQGLAAMVRRKPPGSMITININDEVLTGVVTAIKAQKTIGNPVAPSKWIVEVAFADAQIRKLRIPASRFNDPDRNVQVIAQVTADFATNDFGRQFDDLQSDARQIRVIATGNLLSAIEALKKTQTRAPVVFYTDENGTQKRGLLLPVGFNIEHWQDQRPVVFKTGEKLLDFLKQGGQASTPDGKLIALHVGDNLILRAVGSKLAVRKYITNQGVLTAANGVQFESIGPRWDMSIPPGRAQEKVLDALLDLTAMQTTSGKDLARQLGNSYSAMMEGLPPETLLANSTSILRQSRSQVARDPEADIDPIAAQDIIKTLERIFKVPIRIDGFNFRGKGEVGGIYNVLSEVVRLKRKHMAALGVAMHEIGHHIDKQTGIADENSSPIPASLQNELRGLDYEPKDRLFEGFAEYIRMYITEQGVEDRVKLFHRWFTKVWMKQNPEWAKPLEEARAYCQKFADQSVFARLQTLIGGTAKDLNYWAAWQNEMQTKLGHLRHTQLDNLAGLEYIDKLLAQEGRTGLKTYDTAMRYSLVASAEAESALKNGVHDIRGSGRYGGPALWSASQFVNNREEEKEATAYAYARHTVWYYNNINRKYNTGMDLQDAIIWLKRMEDEGKKDRYEKYARVIADFGDDLLRMQADAGVITRAEAAKLIDLYDGHYFPLLRATHKGMTPLFGKAGFVNLPKPLRRRSSGGSGERILDPFDAMMAKTEYAYQRAAKARVMNVIVQALDPRLGGVQGFGKFLDRVDPKNKETRAPILEILNTLVKERVVSRKDAQTMRIAMFVRYGIKIGPVARAILLRKYNYDPVTATKRDLMRAALKEPDLLATISIWRPDFTPNAQKRTVHHVLPSGQSVLYEMDDLLYRIATGLDDAAAGEFAGILHGFNVMFKGGAVGANTFFAGKNLLRDYQTFIGRAEYTKGSKVFTEPPVLLAAYLWQKTGAKFFGQKNALVELFDETGGRLYTKMASISGKKAIRREAISKEPRSFAYNVIRIPGKTIWGAVKGAYSGLETIVALSDIAPRLTEMKSAIESEGYTYKQGVWYDTVKNKPVKSLPEHVVIKASMAASNATVNYKRRGAYSRKREFFAPLINAQINAQARQIEIITDASRTAWKGKAASSKDKERAKRYFLYLAGVAAIGAAVWKLRNDDDDYRDMDLSDKMQYWSFRWNGQTIFYPKTQDEAIVSNVVEGILDNIYHEDATPLGDIISRDIGNRIPAGGGFFRGILEVTANWDFWRDRPVTPYYEKPRSEYRKYNEYTTNTSWMVGQLTGRADKVPVLGHFLPNLSPIEVQHLLNSWSGGAYVRYTEMYDQMYRGLREDGWTGAGESAFAVRNLPFVGWAFPNELQSRALNTFYRNREQAMIVAGDDDDDGLTNTPAQRELARINGYHAIMSSIRQLQPLDSAGRKTRVYQSFLVGLAREALGWPALKSSPSPFSTDEMPEEIREIVKIHTMAQAEKALLSHGRPLGDSKDEMLADRLAGFKADRQAAFQWLLERKKNPIVRDALYEMLHSRRFLTMKFAKPPSTWPTLSAAKKAGWATQQAYAQYLMDSWQEQRDWLPAVEEALSVE